MMLTIEIDNGRHWSWWWWPGQADLKRTFPWLNIEAGDVSPEVLPTPFYSRESCNNGFCLKSLWLYLHSLQYTVRKAPNLSVTQLKKPTDQLLIQAISSRSVKAKYCWTDKALNAASSPILKPYKSISRWQLAVMVQTVRVGLILGLCFRWNPLLVILRLSLSSLIINHLLIILLVEISNLTLPC